MSVNSKNLAQIIQGNKDELTLRANTPDPLQLTSSYRVSKNGISYYIGIGRRGRRLFGVDGNSWIFYVPESVFRSLGVRHYEQEVPLTKIVKLYRKYIKDNGNH
jgi:hypothetical protein